MLSLLGATATSINVTATPLPLDNIEVLNVIEQPSVALFGGKEAADQPFDSEMRQALVNKLTASKEIKLFGESVNWHKLSRSEKTGLSVFKLPLQVSRYTQGKLTLTGLDKASVYLNGISHNIDGKALTLALKNGDHQLIIIARVSDFTAIKFDWIGKDAHDQIGFYDQNSRRVYPEQLFDSETVSQLSLAPDGKQLLWTKKHFEPIAGDDADEAISVMELRDYDSQKLLSRWQGSLPHSMNWSADNKVLAFVDGGKISLLDRKTREISRLSASLEQVSGLSWYDNNSLLFSWNKSADKASDITKRYLALEDRWSGWRDNSQLYLIDIHSGAIRQLTDGKASVSLLDSKPGKLLLSREIVDYQLPAHTLTELSELDMSSNRVEVIGQYRTLNNAKYATGGIYILAGPGFKDGLGKALGSDKALIPNNYDTQLYWRDDQGVVSALSKSFDPSIGQIKVLPNDELLMLVTDKDARLLYHFDPSQEKYRKLATDIEVVESFSATDSNRPLILFKGTGATKPQLVATMSLESQQNNVLFDSKKQSYQHSKLGSFKQWDFTNSRGEKIAGRYYLPPQFDANVKYPTLVYYYGGTSPVSRAFTGRYPFNLWAAQGYVVYVLQPSGTTGFGQQFSAKHVNAWGKHTAQDIIEGTKAFAKAHSFVNKDSIGNLGASYGGFMTMYLATKTDIFAASLSHAGISNLSNYWGYGWWGYAYSGVASAGSFPWNNRQLYVEQSPLYHADKINTPLLLIHGDSDTNVPVSESHSMYTALKLLGKDVDLIEFKGQNHTFNQRSRRLIWWDTTLAFFDKQLKGQPQWWNSLYPQQ